MDPELTLPRPLRSSQFRLRRPPLRKDPAGFGTGKALANGENRVQRRKSARTDRCMEARRDRLDAGMVVVLRWSKSTAWRRNSARLRRDSTKTVGWPRNAATIKPGNPAPVPRSIQLPVSANSIS